MVSCDPATFYRDADSDGIGDVNFPAQGCEAPNGYVTHAGDCDDMNPLIYPGGIEVCNGKDDDCDGMIDDMLDAITCGQGACQLTVPSCRNGEPQTCTPGLPSDEVCDGVDNDCDGTVDEDCVVRLPLGAACGANSDCQSSFCTDGVCCNSACSGTCESCRLAGGGTCTAIPLGQDPDYECPGGTCNGSRACTGAEAPLLTRLAAIGENMCRVAASAAGSQ
jgi:hypothetical protein